MTTSKLTHLRGFLLIASAALCLGVLTTAFASGLLVNSGRLTVSQSATSVPCTEQVSISNFQFTSATVTITAGCSVTWTNTVSTKHSTTSDTNGLWDSGLLNQNETFTRVFSSTGTFSYRCKVHPAVMTGTIVVN